MLYSRTRTHMSTAGVKELIGSCVICRSLQMSGDVVVRRARPDDYVSVINIIDDFLNGDDYLPTLYYVILQSTNHVSYIAKVNGRVV